MNCKVYRVVGQMRSGNHAFLSWFLRSFGDKTRILFLNNIPFQAIDPYLGAASYEVFGNVVQPISRETLHKLDVDVLVVSYEDRRYLQTSNLTLLEASGLETDTIKIKDQTLSCTNVLILRDPLNLLASRLTMLRTRGALGGVDDINTITQEWINLADFAYQTLYTTSSTVIVNYNQLIASSEYRQNLSHALCLSVPADFSTDTISHQGGGSSFGTLSKFSLSQILRSPLKVFSLARLRMIHVYLKRLFVSNSSSVFTKRWEQLAADPEFRSLFDSPKLRSSALRLFDLANDFTTLDHHS